jgi:hypothetical protein
MKTVTGFLNGIIAGEKLTIFKLRKLMGYIDRKPSNHLEAAKEVIRDHKPKLSDYDSKLLISTLRSTLTASEDYIRKGVNKEYTEQFVTLNTIFVKDIQENKIGDFTIHLPIYQITYGQNELGFSFYLSANKPVFL